ncbi:MAG: nuclear transport factor 2 family protein [Ilumatobacteraceae bacterium]
MFDRDSDAVRRLLYAYGDAVLARDARAWGALWTDDAVWEIGPDRRVEGRDAIVGLWRTAMADYRHVVQLYTSSTATIDGDEAVGRAHLVELNVPVEGDRRTLVGWYDDDYRRTAEGWRFSRRALHRLYAGAADLSGQFFGVELD